MPNYVKIINVGREYVIVKSGLSNIWFRCAMKPEVSSESLRISPQADSGNYCSLRLSGWGVAKPEVFLKKVWGSHQSHLRLILAIASLCLSVSLSLVGYSLLSYNKLSGKNLPRTRTKNSNALWSIFLAPVSSILHCA